MSYIGSTPTTQNFIAGTDSFNGTGSATNFTLSRFVNSVNDVQVVVNNVVQYPPNYSVSGNTLTISPAPSAGTNNVYVRYLSTTLQSVTPPGGTTVNGSWGVNGDLNFYGNARRITGDFSNATIANRVMFQSSTTNGNTIVSALPNGTSSIAQLQLFNASDLTNAGQFQIAAGAVEMQILANRQGTGTYLPMTFYTGGSERMRVDTSGNVGIGKTPSQKLDVAGRGDFTIGSPGILQNWNDTSSNNIQVGTTTDGLYISNTSNKAMWFATNNTERMRIDSSGNVGIGLTPAGTGFLEIKAGTTSAVPLELTAGTNATTAVAGGVEYDGRVFYATPQGTQRGVVPGVQFFRLNSGLVGANVNTAQSVFGVGVTLSASTVYAFEAVYAFSKTAGTTAHTLGIGFGGTATLNNIGYEANGSESISSFATRINASTNELFVTSASNTTFSTSNTNATVFIYGALRGTVSINAGGTFIPQYTLSAAPGGAYTTAIGSYFSIYPISASGANTSVGTWA